MIFSIIPNVIKHSSNISNNIINWYNCNYYIMMGSLLNTWSKIRRVSRDTESGRNQK